MNPRHTPLGTGQAFRESWSDYTNRPAARSTPITDLPTHKSRKREYINLLDDMRLPPSQQRGPDLRGIYSKQVKLAILKAYRNSIRKR